MSLSGPLAGISFTGLGSGIDTDSIVSQIIQVESLPIFRLQNQQAILMQRQDIYGQLESALNTFASASSVLSSLSGYLVVTATSSDDEVATISAGTGAQPGIYELAVSKLAKSHKVSSDAQAAVDSELGLTGSFSVNGVAVDVVASDTITTLAQKINSTNSGVIASIIDGGAGSAYLTVASSATGAKGTLQMADISGGVLGTLDLISGASSFRDQFDSDSVRSYGFSSSSDDLNSLMGSAASGNVTIGSTVMAIDFAADSLQDIADRINGLGEAETATVVSIEEDGVTTYKLEISGSGGLPTIVDTNGLLEAIGVYQKSYSNQLATAQDAAYTLDGIALTSSSNQVTDAIPGVTLTMLDADATTPKTATLQFDRDTASVVKNAEAFMNAYNELITLIDTNSEFDEESFASGPLFGDTLASQIEGTIGSVLFSNMQTGDLTNLTQVGFGFDEDGKLTLDTSKLQTELAEDPEAVRKLFMVAGESSASGLSFISAGTDAVESGAGSYAVNITQAATLGNVRAAVAQTIDNAGGEVLTFIGGLFGSGTVDLFVDFGSILTELIDKINTDDRFNDILLATNDGGTLKIESKRYGADGSFSVVSNLAAASNNSGIGTAGQATETAGLDVMGTINGEVATGSGQFLTGDEDNATTDGLQIQYTGAALGLIGSVSFSRGIASRVSGSISTFTDSVNGLLSTSDDALQSQIDDIDVQIANLQEQLASREAFLRQQFLAMERAISSLQTQMSQLGSFGIQGS